MPTNTTLSSPTTLLSNPYQKPGPTNPVNLLTTNPVNLLTTKPTQSALQKPLYSAPTKPQVITLVPVDNTKTEDSTISKDEETAGFWESRTKKQKTIIIASTIVAVVAIVYLVKRKK